MVTIQLNGQELTVPENRMVLEVARNQGLDIPTLCFHEALGPYGACRLCLVEAEGPTLRKGLLASCTLTVSPGMVIETDSPPVVQARKVVLELLLGRAPESRPLKALAERFGVTTSRFGNEAQGNCVRCGLCVRVCREKIGAAALCFAGRGQKKQVTAEFGQLSETCIGCGTCVNLCPADAIHLEDLGDQRRIFLPENTISRLPLVACRLCETPFQTEKFIAYVRHKSDIEGATTIPQDICPSCARKVYAETITGDFLV
ncbi:MAG: (2Fe-2S)-binding protein [Deltaproteobacteria bacterium]|nr:(2Fe-2S)-binding protein [Deltaproteobacteria bacterium]